MNKPSIRGIGKVGTAVGSLLLAVACTKGGDSAPPPQSNIAPPPPTAKPAPTSSTIADQLAKKVAPPTELDRDSSRSSADMPKPPPGSAPSAPPDQTPAPTQDAPSDEIVMDPSGMKPEEIFAASAKQGAAPVGPEADVKAADKLFYSGAAQDTLHEELQSIVNSDKDSQTTDNKRFAMSVGLTTFMVNPDTREAKATVTLVGENGEKRSYEFKGVLDNQSRLRGGDLNSGLAFESVCMDEKGGCGTVQIRLRRRLASGVAMAHVIARHSTAYIYSDGIDPNDSTNPEFIRLMGIFVNTANTPHRADTVRALSFWTSETINGRSEFSINMVMGVDPYRPRAEQTFSMSGPLVKPASSTEMDLVIARPSGLTTVNGRTVVARGSLMDSLREIHLVKNDGRGNLQFDISVRKGSARAEEETIHLTVARINEPVRSPILR